MAMHLEHARFQACSGLLALFVASVFCEGLALSQPAAKPGAIKELGMFHAFHDDSYWHEHDFTSDPNSFAAKVRKDLFPSGLPIVCQRYTHAFPEKQIHLANNLGLTPAPNYRKRGYSREEQLNGWKMIIDAARKKGLKVLVGGTLYREFCYDAGSTPSGTMTMHWEDNSDVGGVDHELDASGFGGFLDAITAHPGFDETVQGWYLSEENEFFCDKSEYDKMYNMIKSHPRAKGKPVYITLQPAGYYLPGLSKKYNYDGRKAGALDRPVKYGEYKNHPWYIPGTKTLYRQQVAGTREYSDWAPMTRPENRPDASVAGDIVMLEVYPFYNQTVNLDDWRKFIANVTTTSKLSPDVIAAVVQAFLGEAPQAVYLAKEKTGERPDGRRLALGSQIERNVISAKQMARQVEYIHALGVNRFYVYGWTTVSIWEEGSRSVRSRGDDAQANWSTGENWQNAFSTIAKQWQSTK